MSVLTSREITNLYLYGTKTTPDDLLSESRIRPVSATTSVKVNINDYMAEVGRFASPAFFKLIEKFFSSGSIVPSSYTEAQMRQMLDVDEKFIVQKQWAFSDGTDDYAERVYIWNSVAFEIDDASLFVVDANGDRRIENFAIIPLNRDRENFDFESKDGVASLGNGYLEGIVDPSGIGRKVFIEFDGQINRTTLDQQDYIQAVASKPNESSLPRPDILSVIQDLTDNLFSSGATRALFNEKPIFYGSQQNDVMSGYDAKNEDIDDHRQLDDFASNGVVYVGGQGNDTIKGTQYDDVLIGGSGQDSMNGGAGDDTFFIMGEDSAYDTFTGGEGTDTILGSDGDDIIRVHD